MSYLSERLYKKIKERRNIIEIEPNITMGEFIEILKHFRIPRRDYIKIVDEMNKEGFKIKVKSKGR